MSKQSYSICLMLVSILVASCQSFGVGTPAVTTTPTASFTPTPTSVPSPTPTPIREGATPPVLRDVQYQVVMPQASLLFSYRQEKVRQIDGDESHFRLGLNIRNSAITITIFPRNGDSLEQLMRNEELYWDPNTHKTSEATPNGLAQLTPFLVDGSAALRTLLLYNDLRVAFAIIERGDQCVLVIAWGGEMDGDVIYPESDRQRIYDLFNELLATFRFSTKDS